MRLRTATLAALACALAAAPAASAAPDPLRAQQWGLDEIEADAAHATSTGTGAVVAVIDSGVLASHEDLAGRLLPGHDFIDDDADPDDGNGHGTHVSGIVAATAGNGKGIEGVAPGAKVLPIRVLDDDGEGTGEGVAKGIDYAVDHGADVINLSLGGDAISAVLGGDEAFTNAVQRALDAGVVVVAAAGNDTLPFCEQPSVQGPLLCVGAIDRREMRTFYSSSGDIVAPGGSAVFGGSDEDILSTFNDGGYETLAGTSQATPHVAGVAALLVSLGLHGQAVADRILATTKSAPMAGAGILNAKNAVAGLSSGGSGGGGGGGSGSGGGPSGSAASISYRRTQSIEKVLERGVRVRCRAAGDGRCRVRVKKHGRRIARGSAPVDAGSKQVVTARVTKAGRRMLRHRRHLRARLVVRLPGGPRKGHVRFVR